MSDQPDREQAPLPLQAHGHTVRHLLSFNGGQTYFVVTKVVSQDGTERVVERARAVPGAQVDAALRTGAAIVVPL